MKTLLYAAGLFAAYKILSGDKAAAETPPPPLVEAPPQQRQRDQGLDILESATRLAAEIYRNASSGGNGKVVSDLHGYGDDK